MVDIEFVAVSGAVEDVRFSDHIYCIEGCCIYMWVNVSKKDARFVDCDYKSSSILLKTF